MALFSKSTQAIFYCAGFKQKPIQGMLDFDVLCGRETPSIACVVQPGAKQGFHKLFFADGGKKEIALPLFGAIGDAVAAHPNADVFINFASFRSAFASTLEALAMPSIRVVAVIAEGVPEKDTRTLIAYARKHDKVIIGPATVGGIQAGSFKIGDTAGTIDNIVRSKLYRPGSVGFVSKSGGMSNEAYNIISQTTDGVYEGIAIGGDAFPGSTLSDHAKRYQRINSVRMIVVLGEIGGKDEYSLVEAMKAKEVTKPVVAWVSGTCAKLFTSEVQFGHAGAKSGTELESAQAKNAALAAAGAIVPNSFEGLGEAIAATFKATCGQGGQTAPSLPNPLPTPAAAAAEVPPPPPPGVVPEDLAAAKKRGAVRVPTNVVSSISDERGEELTYNGMPISGIIEQGLGIGDIIGLLWFKKRLPKWSSEFIELCIIICADHGPCVSGAHNAIVTSRAGKDITSCLASGILTIGPRFGGAIDDAARYMKEAKDLGQAPDYFVESMKKKGRRVAGIGHRIKSKVRWTLPLPLPSPFPLPFLSPFPLPFPSPSPLPFLSPLPSPFPLC